VRVALMITASFKSDIAKPRKSLIVNRETYHNGKG